MSSYRINAISSTGCGDGYASVNMTVFVGGKELLFQTSIPVRNRTSEQIMEDITAQVGVFVGVEEEVATTLDAMQENVCKVFQVS